MDTNLNFLKEDILAGKESSGPFRGILEHVLCLIQGKNKSYLYDFQEEIERFIVRMKLSPKELTEAGYFLLGKIEALADMAGAAAWHIPDPKWVKILLDNREFVNCLMKRKTIEDLVTELSISEKEAKDKCTELVKDRIIITTLCGSKRVYWATFAAKNCLEYEEIMEEFRKRKK